MKTACSKHEIIIQTDPKNCEYVIISDSGAQRKTEDFDVEDAETFELPADEEREKLAEPVIRQKKRVAAEKTASSFRGH
ncbi:hypothetical protein JHK87_028657 [Glycine soja]|nr:hypothetical protein JHK87_028657 [Glycine soja]